MNLGLFPDADAYDAAVSRTDGIDKWCSSTDWVLPLTASMHPQDPTVIRTEAGWGVFDRATDVDGRRMLMGVDRVWGFACPVIGTASTWVEIADAANEEEYDVVVLSGLIEGGDAWNDALTGFDATHLLHRAGTITRCQADLRMGFDHWFGNRSPRFRRQLKRLRRDAAASGLDVVEVEFKDASALLDRLIAIERESWKGADGEGLMSTDMADFYRLVATRLGARTRCLVACLDGRDVGYIVGGVRGAIYRGLQLSATEDVRAMGVGHLLQIEQIEQLCGEGVGTYDLGMDMAYKHRWADHMLETTTIAAFPRSSVGRVSAAEG